MLKEYQKENLRRFAADGLSEKDIELFRQSYETDNARTPEERERRNKVIEHIMPRYMSECPAGYVHVERTV